MRKIYDKYNVNLNNNKNLEKKTHLIINASTHLLKELNYCTGSEVKTE